LGLSGQASLLMKAGGRAAYLVDSHFAFQTWGAKC
jgi:hypothetical protein